MVKKTFQLIAGSMMMGLGISTAIQGGFGVDSMALFWEGVNIQTGLSLGMINIILSLCMVVIIYFIEKEQLGIGTIVNAIVMSTTMDILNAIFVPSNVLFVRILMFMIGLGLLAAGIAYYGHANFGRGAFDGLVFAISNTTSFSIRTIRTLADFILVVSALLLGANLKIGPIISVFCLGYMIQAFHTRFAGHHENEK